MTDTVAGPTLRRATAGDIDRLTELVRTSSAYSGRYASIITHFEITLEDLRDFDMFVIDDADGRAQAFYSLTYDPPELHLAFVADDTQGRGLGRVLMDHMLARVATAGLDSVRIVAHPPAEGFYLRLGAERIGTVPPLPPVISWERPLLWLAVSSGD